MTEKPTPDLPTQAEGKFATVVKSFISPQDIPIVVGVMPAEALSENHEIPRRDTRTREGYQREPSTTRVNRLVQDLSKGRVALPTALLLNLREYDPALDLEPTPGVTRFRLDGRTFHVVDGQHRALALAALVKADPDRWSSFSIPFVCMLGATQRQEMEQFYVVNSTAKSVRTDLALDLLKQRAETDTTVMQALLERGEDWKVRAQALVEAMAESSSWRGRIRFPGEPKADTTISSSGLAFSLKPLLDTPYFGQLAQASQLKILDSFWRGVRAVLPKAFDDPSTYTVQKSVGVNAMHSLLVNTLEYIRSQGRSVLESEQFADALKRPLTHIQGDTTEGAPVIGHEFWLSGPSGAAGAYSSSAGQRVLIARLRSLLPRLEIE